MKPHAGSFWRDASDHLCFEMPDVDSLEYPALAAKVAKLFELAPVSEILIAPEAMFRDYTNGKHVVGLEWDIWSGFIVTPKSPDAESLVTAIGTFLSGKKP